MIIELKLFYYLFNICTKFITFLLFFMIGNIYYLICLTLLKVILINNKLYFFKLHGRALERKNNKILPKKNIIKFVFIVLHAFLFLLFLTWAQQQRNCLFECLNILRNGRISIKRNPELDL